MQKPPRSKNVGDTNEGISSSFMTHLEREKYEKRMTKGKELEVPEDSKAMIQSFLHRSDSYRQLHYSVFNGGVGNMLTILPKRHHTLLITDILYGFRNTWSMYDDVPYKYPQIEKMVDFAELTLTPLWRIVIFHSMGQSLFVTTTLKSRCHAIEHMHW